MGRLKVERRKNSPIVLPPELVLNYFHFVLYQCVRESNVLLLCIILRGGPDSQNALCFAVMIDGGDKIWK